MSRARLERFGRIWIAADATAARAYLAGSLLVPRGRRERLGLMLGRLRPDETTEAEATPNGTPLAERFAPVEAALSAIAEKGEPPRWILVEDYETARRRAIVFLFADGRATEPFAVVKVRAGGEGPSLRRERDAIERVGSGGMRGMIPAVRAFSDDGGREILTLTPVRGASLYREMKAALVPRTRVERHFDLAASWLERFQAAQPGAHGDFWARNLLVDRGAVAAVDWEHFDAAGDPLADVVHFPLTYALAFRWDGRDAIGAVERFRRGFVERTVVSRAVAGWMRRFAARTSLDALRLGLVEHLERGSAGTVERPQLAQREWATMRDLLRGGTACAFSG